MYASITIFLKQEIGKLLELAAWYNQENFLSTLLSSSFLDSFFDFFYIGMITMAVIVSLTTPVDRGISYFKFLMIMFGLLLIATMTGIIFYLINTGFYPEEEIYNPFTKKWIGTGEHHFSVLVFCGVIMTGVFLIPMILRPFDFLSNGRNYIIGLFSYLFMMPTFINVMQIYAMCNLHDISWGNRPT